MPTPPLELNLTIPDDIVSPLLIRYDIANDTYSVIKGTPQNESKITQITNGIGEDRREHLLCNNGDDLYYIIDFDRPYNIKPVVLIEDIDISKGNEFSIADTSPLIVKKENKGNNEIMSNRKLSNPIKNQLNNLYKQDGRPCIIDNSKGIIYYYVYFGLPPPRPVASKPASSSCGPAWLHGKLWKQEVTSLIEGAGMDEGRFAVWLRDEAATNQWALSVVYKSKVTHHMIAQDEAAKTFTVNKKSYGDWTTLEALIEAMRGPLPGWPVRLAFGTVLPTPLHCAV